MTQSVFRFFAVCAVLAAPFGRAFAAEVVIGDFRLAVGHAARAEVAFPVVAPGTIHIRLERTAGAERLGVMVMAGTSPVFNTQFTGATEFDVVATRDTLARGQEWSVRVVGTVPHQLASGRVIVTVPALPSGGAHALDAWLRARPSIAGQMIWHDGRQPLPYSVWPDAMRRRLWAAFDAEQAGTPVALADPAPNAMTPPAGEAATSLRPDVAQAVYVAAVARSLSVEIGHRVPWSLLDLNEDERRAVLSSLSFFHWDRGEQTYRIEMFEHGWATPAPPQITWRFLEEQHLLKSTRLDTIIALLGWTQQLVHFAGGHTWQNAVDHWGYAGAMPVSRALAGTKYSGTEHAAIPAWQSTQHFTAGCHGTAGLLLNVLRAANIPLQIRGVNNGTFTHATVIFLSEDRALTHGDDPYSQSTRTAPPAALMIDLETYNAWLGPLAQNPGENIGRRAIELGRDFAAAAPSSEPVAASRSTAEVWIEAESLPARASAGTAEVQAMDGFPGTWRGGRQLWWHDAQPGAELSLTFDIAADGLYDIAVALTRAPDYGIASIRVDDGRAVDGVNAYGPDVVIAPARSLGEYSLRRGAHTIAFTLTGTDPRAVAAFMLGVDAIRIVRVNFRRRGTSTPVIAGFGLPVPAFLRSRTTRARPWRCAGSPR